MGGTMVLVPAVMPTAAADRTERSGQAKDAETAGKADGNRYSDRDRVKGTANERKQLESALKTGEEKSFYRRELEKQGFMITAVNYDKPDYVEYEVVKGPNSYEVQIDFDRQSHKAKKVDVTYNAWQAESTERALGQNKRVDFPKQTTSNPERFSDRERVRVAKGGEENLEQALKTGEEKSFYRRELEKRGWKITSVNYDKPDYVEYEVVKGRDSFEVQIDFDKNSHKANKVDVVTNIWKADATKKALQPEKDTQARR
jgi:hypothetical protein